MLWGNRPDLISANLVGNAFAHTVKPIRFKMHSLSFESYLSTVVGPC